MLTTKDFIGLALDEDIGNGDITSLATIPFDLEGFAVLLAKEDGVLSGLALAIDIFSIVDPHLNVNTAFSDGVGFKNGTTLFTVTGNVQSILKAERLVLNCLQRLSGIATKTRAFTDAIKGTKSKILDTRKTTPLLRKFEKEAVVHGGGHNHRFGLFDLILIKDNHVDASGGIIPAINRAVEYRKKLNANLLIEVETRNLTEVQQALESGYVDRIMLDNFSPDSLTEAVILIKGSCETEASGGINLKNIRQYAETGVEYISVGALTHSVNSIDMSLKYRK